MIVTTDRTPVLIADARWDVREALRSLLEATDEFEVVGEAATPQQAMAVAAARSPRVIILDPNGAYNEEALDRLAATPATLVFLTLRNGLACRAKARELGALVADKGATPEDLLNLLRRADRRGLALSQALAS
jgi:DNA-binding NarL/FixJ family response regulator